MLEPCDAGTTSKPAASNRRKIVGMLPTLEGSLGHPNANPPLRLGKFGLRFKQSDPPNGKPTASIQRPARDQFPHLAKPAARRSLRAPRTALLAKVAPDPQATTAAPTPRPAPRPASFPGSRRGVLFEVEEKSKKEDPKLISSPRF